MEMSNLIIAIIVTLSVIAIMFLVTRFCTRFLWLVLFCYPHSLTEGLLPLNIGLDDLYAIALGIVVLFKRACSGRTVFGFATIGALIFWAISSLSDMTGALTGPELLMRETIKASMKGIVYVIFGFIMDNTMDNRKDVESTLRWMIFAGMCGAITVIGQVFYEPLFRMFAVWRPEEWRVGMAVHIYGGGSFLDKNAAGMMMVIFSLFCISRLRIHGAFSSKPLFLGLCFLFSVGLILTQSRAAWIGMVVAIFFLLLFSPLRGYAFIFGIMGLAIIFSSEFMKEVLSGRLGGIGWSAANRVGIWFTILRNVTPYVFFCGRGALAEYVRLQATPHNSFIHILFELGLFGAIWAIWFFGKLFRTAHFLRKYGDAHARFAGDWVLYALVGIFVCGVTADFLFVSFVRYTLFFMAALVYRYKLLIEQEPQCSTDFYEYSTGYISDYEYVYR